ncbi:MAG: DUF192 domain-containing protein [Planctomycetaceae bacterium]|nr:MAG: DUF192 domain-containing protein [Planctomycetaceae bacterium]
MRVIAAVFILALAIIPAVSGCNNESKVRPGPAVAINSAVWRVELAVTPQQRHKGLSGRWTIPQGRGMLFIFHQPQVLEFWMDGCFVPIDIAFISADKRVLQVYTMYVEPDYVGREKWTSSGPDNPGGVLAKYALEVQAGELSRNGVRVGDTVVFSEDIPDTAKADDAP